MLMKRLTIFMAVMALVVALMAGSVSAKQNGKNRVTYNFKGVVQEVAVDGSYVVVDVTGGNKRSRDHLGPQSFAVTPDTRIEVDEQRVDPSALTAGDRVRVQSRADKDATEFDARKISAEHDED
jgi:hypothetical protein